MKILIDLPEDVNNFIEYIKVLKDNGSKEKTIIKILKETMKENYSIMRNEKGKIICATKEKSDIQKNDDKLLNKNETNTF